MKTVLHDRQAGFSAVEVAVVLMVLSVLALIAIPRLSAARERGHLAALKSDLRNLATVQESHREAARTYASNLTTLGFTESDGVTVTFDSATATGWGASAVHAALPGTECRIDVAAVASSDPSRDMIVHCSDPASANTAGGNSGNAGGNSGNAGGNSGNAGGSSGNAGGNNRNCPARNPNCE